MKTNRIVLLLLAVMFSISALFSQQTKSRIIENGGTGKYSAIMLSDTLLPTHTIFRPADISTFTKKHKLPLIVWGNGACFNSPWEHVNFLNEIASHGFMVIAIGIMPEENGEKIKDRSQASQLTDAIDWALAQNKDKNSVYFGRIDSTKIAVSGMSCGGLQALEVCGDPRISTLVVCNSGLFSNPEGSRSGMPEIGKEQLNKIHKPTLYLLGGPKDIAYNNGMDDYSRINHVPVFVGNMDVGHGGTYGQPHGGDFARVANAWFRWQLKNDRKAGKMFKGNPCKLSLDKVWTVQKKNMP